MKIDQMSTVDTNGAAVSVTNDLKETAIRKPGVDLNIYKPKNPVEVPVVKSVIATHSASPNFVRHIEFDLSGTDLENRVLPG